MPIIQNGQGLEIAVPPGQSIAVASLTGTYSATLLDGAGRGVLASASTGGATYGPYPAGATLRVKAGVDSCVAYDVGASPIASGQYPARFATNAQGDISGLSDNDGGLIPLIGMALSTDIGRAAINAEKINAALSKRGHVVIAAGQGTVYVSETLIIESETHLQVGKGTRIRRTDGMRAPILENRAHRNHEADARTTVTIAWTEGSVATVTWPNHGLTRKNYIWTKGATGASANTYNSVFRVMSVLSANTFTIHLPEVPKAAAGGTIRALVCDHAIHVQGGEWDGNYANVGNPEITYNRDNWMLTGIGASLFEDYEHYDHHRGMTSGALADVTFRNSFSIGNDNVSSEAHKTFGPINGLLLENLNMNGSDDAMSIQTEEAPEFAWANQSEGDIWNVTVRKCRGQSANRPAGAAIVLYCANGYKFAGMVFEDCTGHSTQGAGFAITYGNSFNGGTVEDLTLRNCAFSTANKATQFAINIGCPVGILTIENDKTKQSSNDEVAVLVQGAAFIKVMRVRGLFFEDANYPTVVTRLWRIDGEISSLAFEDMRVSGNASMFKFMEVNGRVDNLAITNSNLDNLYRVVKTNGTGRIDAIDLSSNHMSSCPSILELTNVTKPTKVVMNANTFTDVGEGVVRGSTNAGLVAEVYGAGNHWYAGSKPIGTENGALIGVYSEDAAIDPIAIAASLPTTAGQRCRSTRAGATNQGPSVRVAAGWVAIGTGASGANTAIT